MAPKTEYRRKAIKSEFAKFTFGDSSSSDITENDMDMVVFWLSCHISLFSGFPLIFGFIKIIIV